MIATGTDVKPLECVFFLRDVRSASYFEQMKGRGARTISPADFQAVTPDAATKTRFVLVDADRRHRARLRRRLPLGTRQDRVAEAAARQGRRTDVDRGRDRDAGVAAREARTAADASRARRARRGRRATAQGRRTRPGGRSRSRRAGRGCGVSAADRRRSRRRGRASTRCSTRRYSPSRRTPSCVRGSWSCARATTRSSTRSALTCCSTRAASSTPTGHDPSWSRGGRTSTSTATRSPHCRCSTPKPRRRASPSPTCANWPNASSARPTTGRLTSLERLRGDRGRPRAARGSAHGHRPGIAGAFHARRGRRVGAVRRACRATGTPTWLTQQEQAGAAFTDRQRWWLDRIADVIATPLADHADDLDNAPFTERGGVDGALRDLGSDAAATYLDELNAELPA